MPTYEYICKACDNEFEIFQNMSDDRLVNCPKCKKDELKRLIGSGAGIIFKGSGFYETDYRSSNYANAKKKDSDTSKKVETKTKTDKKKTKKSKSSKDSK